MNANREAGGLDPEQLLAVGDQARGKLTIFFGYAAGVGKTYAMLANAHELLDDGVDVLAGYVEPHARPETITLLDRLPTLPPKRVVYRHITLSELDLDKALEWHPTVMLVDELAHTNAPGSRNTERYQDVEELLRAGINVHTTINVQHLESLNQAVSDLTRIQIRETVPDYLFDYADKVTIIDMEPEDLLRRLAAGKVYEADRVRVATQNFFTVDNLRALREIAIRKAADRTSQENAIQRL
jgi:two-component system sensor histidine kinase KdpD